MSDAVDTFKFEVAMGTAEKIRDAITRVHEDFEQRIYQHRGAKNACRTLSKKIQDYQIIVERDCEENKIDLEDHKRIALHITNCALMADKLAMHQDMEIQQYGGKLMGLAEAIRCAEQVFLAEKGQMEARIEQAATDELLADLQKEPALDPPAPIAEESPPPEEPPTKPPGNGGSKHVTPEEIETLVRTKTKEQLRTLAESADVSVTGGKSTLAKRILEQQHGSNP